MEADLELFRHSWSAGFFGERLYDTHFAAWRRRVTACSVTSGHFNAKNAVQYNGEMQKKNLCLTRLYGRTAALQKLPQLQNTTVLGSNS